MNNGFDDANVGDGLGSDPADEQGTAEQFDQDEMEEVVSYPPDRALASEEASQANANGELPPDSVAEREWRLEPEVDPHAASMAGANTAGGRLVGELLDDAPRPGGLAEPEHRDDSVAELGEPSLGMQIQRCFSAASDQKPSIG